MKGKANYSNEKLCKIGKRVIPRNNFSDRNPSPIATYGRKPLEGVVCGHVRKEMGARKAVSG